MYQCKNCGSNLKFDIPSQQLHCDHCSSYFNPYSIQKEEDAKESETYEATVFSCPQCGGEIIADENSAAEFCMYCGAPTILSSRISSQKRPDYIIPFKKTKEDCIKAYKKMLTRSIFAPRSLKDPEKLERFRGIYMPYWLYDIKQSGDVTLKGKKVSQKGSYEITRHFNLNCTLDAEYKGISHDASSYFSDNITECLAPYNPGEMVYFTPSMLSGFYADTADVDSRLYLEDGFNLANDVTYGKVVACREFRGYSVTKPKDEEKLSGTFHSEAGPIKSTLYPVWFLSYRNKDRILYSTVNGQTGKVVADVPIDNKKYIMGSLLLAIPLFFLFNLMFVFRPAVIMSLASVLAFITTIIFSKEMKAIFRRESGEDDRGLNYKRSMSGTGWKTHRGSRKRSGKKKSGAGQGILIFIIGAVAITFMGYGAFSQLKNNAWAIVPVLMLVSNAIASFIGIKNTKKANKQITGNTIGFILPVVTAFIASILVISNPPADWWYYVNTILTGITVLYAISCIIREYNVLSTHKIPELHDRGGDRNEN